MLFRLDPTARGSIPYNVFITALLPGLTGETLFNAGNPLDKLLSISSFLLCYEKFAAATEVVIGGGLVLFISSRATFAKVPVFFLSLKSLAITFSFDEFSKLPLLCGF